MECFKGISKVNFIRKATSINLYNERNVVSEYQVNYKWDIIYRFLMCGIKKVISVVFFFGKTLFALEICVLCHRFANPFENNWTPYLILLGQYCVRCNLWILRTSLKYFKDNYYTACALISQLLKKKQRLNKYIRYWVPKFPVNT